MDPQHLTDELLTDLALGTLDSSTAERVRATLAHSPDALARFERLRSAIQGLSELRAHAGEFEVSRDRITRLQNLVGTERKQPLSSLMQRAADAVATVVFDSLRTHVPGLRGGTGAARLVHLESESCRITIRCERDSVSEMICVTGEISPPGSHDEVVVRDCTEQTERTIVVDETGFFEFEVAPGTWSLRFQGKHVTPVVIDQLDLES